MSNQDGTEKAVSQSRDWESEPIFALDIGTRSIIGIVGIPEGDLFRILDVEVQEHTKRAMIDGQIEDIDQTAKIAGMVKSRLEEKIGVTLKDVFVAAAGRALKTQKASCEIQLDPKELIREQKVLELELGAIQEARNSIEDTGKDTLYCVGHSVIRYYLDDYPLSTLLSHKGNVAKVEIIATFLPNEVVESLYTAMEKTGLNVASVTLEPIAAMNAIIPNELRMLNLALVDVGAGTSDIALSNAGSVSAYTMATIAGDEITETIVRDFLVDFETAEAIKISLSQNVGNIEYQDILGFNYTISTTDVMDKIKPAVENLSNIISERIMEMNEKATAAVFLVGGGSRIPGLCENVAKRLGIAENKVAVGGSNYMKRLVVSDMDIKGPEFATPVGIALTAVMSRARESFVITINGQKKHVFKAGTLSVMDVLMMSGYKQNQIMGRSGQSITIEINQQKKTIRGGYPTPATIQVNSKSASISTPVQTEDIITFEPAIQGIDAEPSIQDVVEHWDQFQVILNDAEIPAGTTAFVNGIPVSKSHNIKNLDIIEIHEVTTLLELCKEAKIDLDKYRFLVNGTGQQGGYILKPEDDIRYFSISQSEEDSEHSESEENFAYVDESDEVDVTYEGGQADEVEEIISSPKALHVTLNGNSAELDPKEDGTQYLFLDMLNFVDIDPSRPEGNIVLKINGHDASYLDVITDGSVIEIYWDKIR